MILLIVDLLRPEGVLVYLGRLTLLVQTRHPPILLAITTPTIRGKGLFSFSVSYSKLRHKEN